MFPKRFFPSLRLAFFFSSQCPSRSGAFNVRGVVYQFLLSWVTPLALYQRTRHQVSRLQFAPGIFREFHGFLKFRRVARVESAFAEAVRSVVSACSSVIVEVTVIPPHVALGLFSISHQKRLGSSHCAFILQRKKNKTQRLKAAPPPCHPKAVFADAPGWPARCRRLVDVKLSEMRF